ncbi:MAG: ATP-binding protein, partial [Stellaceae bacterium]
DHLTALTTLIIDAVKADAAGIALRREPFAPRRLAEAVGEALRARAGNKGVAVEIAIADDLPAMVAGDALRLRAALENLADNAVKFTGEGSIAFTAGAKAAGRKRIDLTFSVADSGIGIDPRDAKKLFHPFTQANEAVARRFGGAGLGLAFVKRIVEAMGGELRFDSKPGRGSEFWVSVPVERVAAQAEDAGGRPAPARSLSLLCAEDNPYGRVVMNTILTELGHRVTFVESGEAAVEAVMRGAFDAVLMDVTLAGIDGMAATRRIRALPGNAGRVPVIGISGKAGGSDGAAARAAGMTLYFAKPVSPAALAKALAGL